MDPVVTNSEAGKDGYTFRFIYPKSFITPLVETNGSSTVRLIILNVDSPLRLRIERIPSSSFVLDLILISSKREMKLIGKTYSILKNFPGR